MVGGQRDHAAHRVELAEVAVHHPVERVGAVACRARACAARSRWSTGTSRPGACRVASARRRRRTRTRTAPRCRPTGSGMPTSSSTPAMPCSSSRRLVGLLGREADARSCRWPSSLRSLSFAVTTATGCPASASAASMVGARSHFGSFIITSVLVAVSIQVVAADAVHRGRRAGHDRQVVRVGEARDHAVGDQRGAFMQRASAMARGRGRRPARCSRARSRRRRRRRSAGSAIGSLCR